MSKRQNRLMLCHRQIKYRYFPSIKIFRGIFAKRRKTFCLYFIKFCNVWYHYTVMETARTINFRVVILAWLNTSQIIRACVVHTSRLFYPAADVPLLFLSHVGLPLKLRSGSMVVALGVVNSEVTNDLFTTTTDRTEASRRLSEKRH